MMKTISILTFAIVAICGGSLFGKSDEDWKSGVWRIEANWNEEYERNFSDFVKQLGASGGGTTDRLLRGNTNIYRARNPESNAQFYADCADFPYILRAYYAYMNSLPFSWVSSVSANGSGRDIRYTLNGNRTETRRTVKDGENLFAVLREISGSVSSAMYRMGPETKSSTYELSKMPDFYPPRISREYIRPGTVVYDPCGHVAIVCEVTEIGIVKMLDAHPDNSVTTMIYGKKFARSRPQQGAGFKNWRPMKKSGGTSGGWEMVQNGSLPGYDLVQYYGTRPSDSYWKNGRFEIEGSAVDYYDYVRVKLARTSLKYEPLQETEIMLSALREDIKNRELAVNRAIEVGIHQEGHPSRLPQNIYGTHGDWETYSTPSRDARLKVAFRELRTQIERFVEMAEKNDPLLDFNGGGHALRKKLLALYEEYGKGTAATYENSKGDVVSLSFHDVEERLFRLSFDPYHCPELRWGAEGVFELMKTGVLPGGREVSSCRDSRNKLDWYVAEQRLRNQIERDYSADTAFSLQDLEASPPRPGNGVESPPVVDIRGYLRTGR